MCKMSWCYRQRTQRNPSKEDKGGELIMVCQNCGLRKDQHEYQRDGGTGSGKPKRGLTKKYCQFYRSVHGY